jgi:inosine/xanthosine triphosphatase
MVPSLQLTNTSKNTVAVGSTNPVKIQAVKQAFKKIWPDDNWLVQGISVSSGVSAQPMSDQESIQGAKNRAIAAKDALKFHWGVGVEGGIQQINTDWFDCGWIAVINHQGTVGLGSTARIITPPKMMALINQGIELGEVVDQIFNTKNSKHSDGHFGLMTQNTITRTSGYVDGVIMALVRFLHPQLF